MRPKILLIIAGILLLLAEILIIPGLGIAGIMGLGAMVWSCVIAWNDFGTKGFSICVIVCCALVIGFTAWVLRAKTWKRFSLHTEITAKADVNPEKKGLSVGQEGVALTRLNPMGKARFGETEVEVRSEKGLVDPDAEIVISRIEEEKIFIKLK